MNKTTTEFNHSMYKNNVVLQNNNSPYKNTDENKTQILNTLKEKIEMAIAFNTKPIGKKNLVYYSVFGVNYSMLFELSLKTLYANNKNINFDILIITDTLTLRLIQTMSILKHFNYFFHIVATPSSGVAASMCKTLLFEYKKINDYKSILFLDVDIICIGDISSLFDKCHSDKLDVVASPMNFIFATDPVMADMIPCAALNYSLCYFTQEQKQSIIKKTLLVFNAGQYLLVNNERMQQHFKNINWLISVWPAAYFYEQSFMNHYFVLNNIVSYGILNDITTITPNLPLDLIEKETIDIRHSPSSILIHFAGNTLNGRYKFQYISEYCKFFKLCQ